MTRRARIELARELVAEALGKLVRAVNAVADTGLLYEIGDSAKQSLAVFDTALFSTEGSRNPDRLKPRYA